MRPPAALGLLLLAACGGAEGERWRYEEILFEEERPAARSRAEADGRAARILEKPSLTLEDCHRLAVRRSETLALDGEELVRLQARFEQSVGGILPRIAYRGSYARQDDRGVISSESVQQSFTLRERTEYKFTLHQPIFAGLREIYAVRQGQALHGAAEQALRHARALLAIDVADAFYAVLEIERDLATTRDSLRLAEERLEELVQRNRAGISRRSEVLLQEAEVASTRALLDRLQGSLAVAWEALKFLTGLSETRSLADTRPDPGELPPLHVFVDRAHALRHDLRALRREILAAEEGIGVARASYFPTVSLDSGYYTHREGISKEVDWDVTLSFEIPIFEGAVTQAQIREARSQVRSASLRLERRRREIELEVARAHTDVLALQAERGSLEKAVSAAEETHEIVQAEYRLAIATNIEVLTAFTTLQRARLERDRARLEARRVALRLEVLSGGGPEEAK